MKIKKIFFATTFIFLWPLFGQAQITTENFGQINQYDVVYEIRENSEINVWEQIRIDYFTPKHGIVKTIPLLYQTDQGLSYKLRIDWKQATDEQGKLYETSKNQASNATTLKVGSAEKTLMGETVFNLKYDVKHAVRYFNDHDEFYWNVLGDWDMPVKQATATVIFPRKINENDLKFICFTGVYGSNEQKCEYQILDEKTVKFRTNVILGNINNEKHDLTIAVWLPKGIVNEPTKTAGFLTLLFDNGFLLLPVAVFLLMYFLWRKYGDDPDLPAIVPQYEEDPRLTPLLSEAMEKNSLIKQRPSIGAEIVWLAINGYLRLEDVIDEQTQEILDYRLIKLKPSDLGLLDYQATLLDQLFGEQDQVELKQLKNKFYQPLNTVKRQLSGQIKKYYDLGPNAKIWFFLLGLFILIGLWILGTGFWRYDLVFAGFVSGVIIMVFALFMPKKNKEGQELEWEIKGLKQYIEVAEKYRADFYAEQNMFEKILPYAMVFGLVDKWAKEFSDIVKEPPEWYRTDQAFNINLFASTINNFSHHVRAVSNPPVSSSGNGIGHSGSSGFSGGFSGGGFGGGTGRSW